MMEILIWTLCGIFASMLGIIAFETLSTREAIDEAVSGDITR